MNTFDDMEDLLTKVSYLDEVISYYHDSHDPTPLQLLVDDAEYIDLMLSKFLYPDRETLMADIGDFSRLDAHTNTIIESLDCWINCISHSTTHKNAKIRFLYVYSGRCVCYVDDNTLPLEAGDTCVIPANTAFHHIGFGTPCHIVHVLMSPEFVQRMLINKLPRNGAVTDLFLRLILDPGEKRIQVVHARSPETTRLMILNALREYTVQRPSYREAMECYLALFIIELLRTLAADAAAGVHAQSADNRRMMEIRRYIESNKDTVTLATLSTYFNLSQGYLSQFIRKNAGKSYTELVQETRLKEAEHLLLHTTMSITEISAECGYQNISYFYQIFKRAYNCTPSEYRVRYQ